MSGLPSFSDDRFPQLYLRLVWHHCQFNGLTKMKLPHFLSRKKFTQLSKQEEQVFAEASELALRRLQQCIDDARFSVPTMRDATQPTQPLRRHRNLF